MELVSRNGSEGHRPSQEESHGSSDKKGKKNKENNLADVPLSEPVLCLGEDLPASSFYLFSVSSAPRSPSRPPV